MIGHLSKAQLSLPGFLLYSIASLLSVPLAYLATPAHLGILLVFALAITAVSGCVAWLCFVGVRAWNPSARVTAYVFLAQLILIGSVRGLAFYLLSPVFGLTDPTGLLFRVANSVVMTIVWLGLTCIVVSGHRRYQLHLTGLVNQAVFLRAATHAHAPHTAHHPETDLDGLENIVALKANLSSIVNHLGANEITKDSLQWAASAVRSEIEENIRPMSHRLWFNSTEGRPETHAAGLLQDSLTELRFSPVLVVLLCAVPGLMGGSIYLSADVNVISCLLSSSMLAISLLLLRMLVARGSSISAFSTVAMLGLVGVIYSATYIGGLHVFQESAAELLLSYVWIFPIAVIAVTWGNSIIIMVNQDRERITAQLACLTSTIPTHPNIHNERLASYLHNSLQSELTGIAYQLENSASSLDSAQSRRSLEQLGALINRSISQDFANFSESPLRRLTRITQAWSGIANVTITMDSTITEQDARLVLVMQVIEEGITNAVRHGQASVIEASVDPIGESLLIELCSNQPVDVGVPRSEAGVGTAWLERYALEKYTLTNVDGRSVLTVEL